MMLAGMLATVGAALTFLKLRVKFGGPVLETAAMKQLKSRWVNIRDPEAAYRAACRVTRWAEKALGIKSGCATRALLAWAVLNPELNAEVVLGFARGGQAISKGHAWLEVRGRRLGAPQNRKVDATLRFG